MNKYIVNRVLNETDYIINTRETVREIAKVFNVSKSTVHRDLQERLLEIDKDMHRAVENIFNEHISIRHINGGESTRKKYLKL